MEAIEIRTSARLHLGFYNFLSNGIAYGSIGIAIDRPVIRVVIRKRGEIFISNYTDEYVDDVINQVINIFNISGAEINIYSCIPRHVGLGSTTQLSLSIAYGLSKLYGYNYSIQELALLLKRGYVSGIGITAFEKGGFIVDSGRRLSKKGLLEQPREITDIPRPIYWSKIPSDWRFIVIVPSGIKGLDERDEEYLMKKPKELPKELQYELYNALIMNIIPGISLNEIDLFSKGLNKIQFTTGRYFSKYQGGVFCCRETTEIIRLFMENNVVGVGQSSWGPVAYGVVKGFRRAKRVLDKVLIELKRLGIVPRYSFIAKPRNTGLSIRPL